MNGLIGLISLSALLLAVSGQLYNLSPSYSAQGALTRSEDGVATFTGTFSVSVDINWRLRLVEEAIVSTAGVEYNNIRLTSESDNETYSSVNNVCTQSTVDNDVNYPINTNVWDLYAAGTEDPIGTYIFTQDGITRLVKIVNGELVGFTFINGTTIIVTVITNFDNLTPAFSTFLLPNDSK